VLKKIKGTVTEEEKRDGDGGSKRDGDGGRKTLKLFFGGLSKKGRLHEKENVEKSGRVDL